MKKDLKNKYNCIAVLTVLFLSFCLLISASEPDKKFFNMKNSEIDSFIKQTVQKNMTITQRIDYYSAMFLGTPYDFRCTGDGPYALYEPWPLVNFGKTNCMALCEHVLALSISDNWDDFFDNLQAIRYRDGLIGMKTRNHYTMADWLPQNGWLLKDVTKETGGSLVKEVTRTISHKKFFAQKGITDETDVTEDRTLTIRYIPFSALLKVEPAIKTGDIGAVIFTDRPGIFAAHMFIIAEKNGKKIIRQASNDLMTTYDTTFNEWVKKMLARTDRYCGIALMRVRPELDTPGRIIKPWEIKELKAKRSGTYLLKSGT